MRTLPALHALWVGLLFSTMGTRLVAQVGEPVPTRCEFPASIATSEILRAEQAQSRAAQQADTGWTQLACTRAELASRGAIGRAGWGMSLGDGWRSGAMRAATQALVLRPGDPTASILYLQLAADSGAASRSDAPSLITSASTVAAGLLADTSLADPIALRACGAFALLDRDLATMRRCAQQALARGIDSTWHLVRLAWVEAGWGSEARTAELFMLAVRGGGSPAGLDALGEVIPSGGWRSKVDHARWTTDAAYREQAVLGALDLPTDAAAEEVQRAIAGHLLGIVPKGTGFMRCMTMAAGDLRPCRSFEPVPRQIRLASQVVRGWSVADAAWVHVVAFALPVGDLPEEGGTLTARLRTDGSRLSEHAWQLPYRARGGGSDGNLLVSVQEIPGPDSITAWTFDVGTAEWRRMGRQYGVLPVSQGASDVTASSLIVGSTKQGVVWRTGTDTIPMMPLLTTSAADPITVTLQVMNTGDAFDGEMRVVLEPYGVGRAVVEPLVTIAAPVRLDGGYSVLQRKLDMSRLRPGTYVVRVRVGTVLEREAVVGVR